MSKNFILFLALAVVLTLYMIFGILQYLLLSKTFFKIQGFTVLIAGALVLTTSDYMTRYTIDPIKSFIYGIIATGLGYSLFWIDSVEETILITGEPTLKAVGLLQIWGSLVILTVLLPFFIFTLRIHLKAPKKKKRGTALTLIGGFIFGIVPFFFYVLKLTAKAPGIIGFCLSLGMLLVSISFARDPKVGYILIDSTNKAKFKAMEKLLTVCAHCKNAKNFDGKWVKLEEFFFKNSNVKFSHGVCDKCMDEHYSDYM